MYRGKDVVCIELYEQFSLVMDRRSEPYLVVVTIMYGVE